MEWSTLLNPKRVGEFLGKEASTGDTRTPFERDYGRAVFCTPVRRLQDKTQVFPLEEHDAVRTRLTHSMEVSSVARNIGREAALWLNKQGFCDVQQVHDIETIAATCGLIHDLGNPPFGHAGEEAIQSWFRNKAGLARELPERDRPFTTFRDVLATGKREQYTADFLQWEGNAQTLRLVSKLQVLAEDFGINLTCATFSAACKYIAKSHEADRSEESKHQFSKPGFFASEEFLVRKVAEETGTQGMRNPITYLVEASDDIVYSTGDLEDAVKKGLMDWRSLTERLRAQISGTDPILEDVIRNAQQKVKYDCLPKRATDEEVVQAFRTFAIAAMKEKALTQFCSNYSLISSGEYDKELLADDSCGAAALVRACKKVGQKYVYRSPSTLKLELMGRKVIHELMDVFWEGAALCGGETEPKECKRGFAGKAYELISTNYRRVFLKALDEKKLPDWYCRLQLVTDQIAGMTDTYAITLHKRLMNG